MNRPHRLVIIVAMALLVLVAVTGTTLLVVGTNDRAASARSEWLGPIATVAVLVGAAAFLGTSGHHDPSTPHGVVCDSCGREVLAHWRMCPYCGAMLDGSVTGTSTTS